MRTTIWSSRSLLLLTVLTATVGCIMAPASAASAQAGKAPMVRDVWFTDREFAPSGQLYSGPPDYHFGPSKSEFEKALGRPVKMVVILKDGSPHELKVQRKDSSGKESSFRWSVSANTRVSSWRATHRQFSIDKLAVGEHTVELTVDGLPAGSYKFSVR